MEEKFDREITSNFVHDFKITEEGLYVLSVKASCKPGWRNNWWIKFKSFIEDKFDFRFDDDDLRVELDNQSFPKPGGRKGLFNSPAAFSGTKMLGKTKTIVFVTYLSQRSHAITFIPDGSPYLKSLSVEKMSNPIRLKLDVNNVADDENYYSWYCFVVVDQPIDFLAVTARADSLPPENDDDDLKIIFNGEVQKRIFNRHPDSYFCGATLKGQTDTFTKKLNFPKGLNYLELFSDKKPTLHSVEINLSVSEVIPSPIKAYRPGPNGENFNRYDEFIKEAVQNWNKEFLWQGYPPPEPLDLNLVKAMIYVESLMGYGSSSGHPAFPDVMQVGNVNDPAIHTLNNDGWIDPSTGKVAREFEWKDGQAKIVNYKGQANAASPQESILWGVRWLYHKAQGIKEGKRYWESWQQAIKDYNGGGDPGYLKKVYKIYKDGTDSSGIKLWNLVLLFLVITTLFVSGFWFYDEQGEFHITRKSVNQSRDHQFYISVLDGFRFVKYPFVRFYADGRRRFEFSNPHANIKEVTPQNSSQKLLVIYGLDNVGYETVKVLSFHRGTFRELAKVGEFGPERATFDGDRVDFVNLDSDPEEEIIESFYLEYDNAPNEIWKRYYNLDPQKQIYEFVKKEEIKQEGKVS